MTSIYAGHTSLASLHIKSGTNIPTYIAITLYVCACARLADAACGGGHAASAGQTQAQTGATQKILAKSVRDIKPNCLAAFWCLTKIFMCLRCVNVVCPAVEVLVVFGLQELDWSFAEPHGSTFVHSCECAVVTMLFPEPRSGFRIFESLE